MWDENNQNDNMANSACFTIVHTQTHPLNDKERSAASLSSRTSQAFWKELEEQRDQSLSPYSNSMSFRRKISNKIKDKCNLLETAFISSTNNKNTSLTMMNELSKTPLAVLNVNSIIQECTSSVDSLETDIVVKDNQQLLSIQGAKLWKNDIQQLRVKNYNKEKYNNNNLSRWRSIEDELMLPVLIDQLTSPQQQYFRRRTLSDTDMVPKTISTFSLPNIDTSDEEEEEEEEKSDRIDVYHTVQLIKHDPIANTYSTLSTTNIPHFDAQLQVNDGQLSDAVRYGVFHSSPEESIIQISCQQFKCNHETQTMEVDENEEGCHSFNLKQYVLVDTLETSMDISESLVSTTNDDEQDYVVKMQIKGTLLDTNHLKLQNIIELNEQFEHEEEHEEDDTINDENFGNGNESQNVTSLMDDGERQYVNDEPSSSEKRTSNDTRGEQAKNGNEYQSNEAGLRNSSSGSGGGGSGSGRGNDEDDDKNNDYNDDNDESMDDETIARRLGFLRFDNLTLELIHSIRQLIQKQSYDRRDFDYLQNLIDKIIKLQQLYSVNNIDSLVRTMTKLLKLDRLLQTFSTAENFLRDRIQYAIQQQKKKKLNIEEDLYSLEEKPVRAVKYQITNDEPVRRSVNNGNGNVFDYWKNKDRKSKLHGIQQRARSEGSTDQQYRFRHDSKDSLEEIDEALVPIPTYVSPRKRRDIRETDREVVEITHDTSIADPLQSVARAPTKVKQMAKDIEYRTVPIIVGTNRSEMNVRSGDRFRDHASYLSDDSVQMPRGQISIALYDVKPNGKDRYSNEERTHFVHPDGITEESGHRTVRTKQHQTYDSPQSSPSFNDSRVKRMVDRLEHDQQLSPNIVPTTTTSIKKSSIKKTFDEYSVDSYDNDYRHSPVKTSKDNEYKRIIKSQKDDENRDTNKKMTYQGHTERNLPKDTVIDGVFFHDNRRPLKYSVDREDDDRSARTTSSPRQRTTSSPRQRTTSSPRQRTTYHSGNDDTYVRIDSVRDEQELSDNVEEFVIPHTKPKKYNRLLEIKSDGTITEPDMSLQDDRHGTGTSITMVRDVRARMYEDNSEPATTSPTTPPEEIMKVDLETLYILEQRSEKSSTPTVMDIYISPKYRCVIEEEKEEHDEHYRTYHPPLTEINTVVQTSYSQPTTQQTFQQPIEIQSDLSQATTTTATTTQTTSSLPRHHKEKKVVVIDADTYRTAMSKSSLESDEGSDTESGAVIYINNQEENSESLRQEKNNASGSDSELDHSYGKDHPTIGKITSKIRMDQIRDLNRNVVRRYFEESNQRSEFYEIHTRGQCKCIVLVVDDFSKQEVNKGEQTSMEAQITKLEITYTPQELQKISLHVLYTADSESLSDYILIKRDYFDSYYDEYQIHPTIHINYYTREGHLFKTEERRLDQIPLTIRCEIEYELNHYGTSRLILLPVTKAERRHVNLTIKEEVTKDLIQRHQRGTNFEQQIQRQLQAPVTLQRLDDYLTRETLSSTTVRRLPRIELTTSLRVIQRYRNIIHRLCNIFRKDIRLTKEQEQKRNFILVNNQEYYQLDLTNLTVPSAELNISEIQKRQTDLFNREVKLVLNEEQQRKPRQEWEYHTREQSKSIGRTPRHPPHTENSFNFIQYRKELKEQQEILDQQHREAERLKHLNRRVVPGPPPPGHPHEAEFYLGAERRQLIEREIYNMRESIRPHEHAPPRYKREPLRRSCSWGYSGANRYVRARIIHVKDIFDDPTTPISPDQQQRAEQQAREQELFIRVDDYINEPAASSLKRSYSTDYLLEDGPRSRIKYIRIPGETIRIEEKQTYEYEGIQYADLPYALRYWNILYILDKEARKGRPLGSSIPHVPVNDPYRNIIPPLTHQEIHQTARQVLHPQYSVRDHTDRTLRWFLSKDQRTEIESRAYLAALEHRRKQSATDVSGRSLKPEERPEKYFVTETLVRYEKLPDRLQPIAETLTNDTVNDTRSVSYPRVFQPSTYSSQSENSNFIQQQHLNKRSQSQPTTTFMQQSSYQNPHVPLRPIEIPSSHFFTHPLARYQSFRELYQTSPPSFQQQTIIHNNRPRRQSPPQNTHTIPIAYNNRFQRAHNNLLNPIQPHQQSYHHAPYPPINSACRPHCHPSSERIKLLTEIIDSQTGRTLRATCQQELPIDVLGLLDKYNLRT